MAQHRAEQIYVIQSKAEGRANLRPAEHSKSKSRSRSCRAQQRAGHRAEQIYVLQKEQSRGKSRDMSCRAQHMAEQNYFLHCTADGGAVLCHV